jgi:hypothetical protein
MTNLAKQFKPYLPKLGVLILLLSFGVLTGFSTVLHAHELDFSSVHDDCAPCHWSQSNPADESDDSELAIPSRFQSFQLVPSESIGKPCINKPYNRGPPAFS